MDECLTPKSNDNFKSFNLFEWFSRNCGEQKYLLQFVGIDQRKNVTEHNGSKNTFNVCSLGSGGAGMSTMDRKTHLMFAVS